MNSFISSDKKTVQMATLFILPSIKHHHSCFSSKIIAHLRVDIELSSLDLHSCFNQLVFDFMSCGYKINQTSKPFVIDNLKRKTFFNDKIQQILTFRVIIIPSDVVELLLLMAWCISLLYGCQSIVMAWTRKMANKLTKVGIGVFVPYKVCISDSLPYQQCIFRRKQERRFLQHLLQQVLASQ
ncbi:Hypothetical_protein [Hexamita inflata]|uniref:Hypothetical_protein n=1 Tax=Hexamita inflata TaxID=28002 RepID=A0AA86UMP8_9EUKA|nr:Hypothetical protein HINF_LOCUS45107 [Hexamita inflata]